MAIIVKNKLKKCKNEEELKETIIDIVNQVFKDYQKVEIIYEYGYTPLNDKIRGICRYDNNELEFKCDEFLNDLKIIFIDKKERV